MPVVRAVLGPETSEGPREVAIDAASRGAGRLEGRAAYMHVALACVEKAAARGLARSFRGAVMIATDAGPKPLTAKSLGTAIVAAETRALFGMLAAAVRSKKAVFGADATRDALRTGDARCVVVATDARASADLTEVRKAVADGLAVAWGTKADLARASGRASDDGVGLVAILNRELAHGVRSAAHALGSIESSLARIHVACHVNQTAILEGPATSSRDARATADGRTKTFSDKQAVE